MRIRIMAAVALASSACSQSSDGAEVDVSNSVASADVAPADKPSVLQTKAGKYLVELDPKLDPKSLPQNADLKMADGDIAQYAVELCDLKYSHKAAATRCDVFVQADPGGALVGYAVLTQGDEVRIDTAVTTDKDRGGLGCFVSGVLESYPEGQIDTARDFRARMGYVAWEKDPGKWMVAPMADEPNQEGAGGMWYVERKRDKLRISQERWNYCYTDSEVAIDEVFRHALTLVRTGS